MTSNSFFKKLSICAGFKNYIAPMIPNTNDSTGMLANLTFQVDCFNYYTTGNPDYNGQWAKKEFLFKTEVFMKQEKQAVSVVAACGYWLVVKVAGFLTGFLLKDLRVIRLFTYLLFCIFVKVYHYPK